MNIGLRCLNFVFNVPNSNGKSQIAGAAAASGLHLEEVAAEANRASDMVGTMGVALSVCTVPGQVTPDRLGPGKMELGLGIVRSYYYYFFDWKNNYFMLGVFQFSAVDCSAMAAFTVL